MALLQTFKQTRVISSLPKVAGGNQVQVRHASTSFSALLKQLSPKRAADKKTTLPYRPAGTDAGSYAAALWQITTDNNQSKETEAQLAGLRTINFKEKGKKLTQGTLTHQKAQIDKIVQSTGVNKDVQKVFAHLLKSNKIGLLPAVADEYTNLQLASRGETLAKVTVAAEPDASTKAAIDRYLTKMTDLKPLIEYKVVPSVKGGFKISAGGYFVDKTDETNINRSLKEFRDELQSEISKLSVSEQIPTKPMDSSKLQLDLPAPVWQTMSFEDFDPKALQAATQRALDNHGNNKEEAWYSNYFAKNPTASKVQAEADYKKETAAQATILPPYQQKLLDMLH